MSYQYADNVHVKLAKSLLAASTTIDFVSATGVYSNPPTPTDGNAVLLKLVNRLAEPTRMEIVSYTGKSGNQLTGVTRGLNGTTARDWKAAGWLVTAAIAGIDGDIQAALDLKLDASAYVQHFRGKFATFSALTAAIPVADAGDYAQVDVGIAGNVVNYNWDDETAWVIGSSGSGATDTDMLPEGNDNLYFTTIRALKAVPFNWVATNAGTTSFLVASITLSTGTYAAPSAYIGCTNISHAATIELRKTSDNSLLTSIGGVAGGITWRTAASGFVLASSTTINIYLKTNTAAGIGVINGFAFN